MSFIEEAIISGFIGKVVSDCVDISWIKIKEADKNRKLKKQNMQTRIYQVIIDAINEITYNKYKNQDILYDVAERILNGFKSDNDNQIEVVRNGLRILISYIENSKSEKFIEILCAEISKDCNFDLYKEILLITLKNATEYNQGEFQQIKELLEKIYIQLDENKINRGDYIETENDKLHQKVKSRTSDYAKKWNENMFLNNFNGWDENAGTNVKLREVYLEEQLPHFIWRHNNNESRKLKELLSEYVNEYQGKKMLLILGQPGIGKSTLITWILHNFIDRRDNILVYQFASDLKNIEWNNVSNEYDIADKVLKELELSYEILNGKTLIIDGFDEISVGNNRVEVLDQLYWQLIKGSSLNNFSLIVTCRENCIPKPYNFSCAYITLQPWDSNQIQNFWTVYSEKVNREISINTKKYILKNREILGIPLILYMLLALNISIENDEAIVNIYDRIFALDGGIYDRCIGYTKPHRIKEIKLQIHEISKRIALWMFENNPDKASVTREEYEHICSLVLQEQELKNEEIKQDLLIGNYFKLVGYCEGIETEEIYFVHRSIYEYFVAESIFCSIKNSLVELSDEAQEEFGKNISLYLKQGDIKNTAASEYLKYKLQKLYNALEFEQQQYFYQWWEQSINKMMKCGMFLVPNNDIQKYIKKVSKCFINLMEILRLVLEIDQSCKREYICQFIEKAILEKYIKYFFLEYDREFSSGIQFLNLEKMNLEEMNFGGINFYYTELTKVNLNHTNLMGAILYNTRIREVNLTNTCIIGAILDISKLDKVIFSVAQIKELEEYYDLQEGDIYVSTEKGIISYKEYCEYKEY